MTDFLKPRQASAFLLERGIRLAPATLNSWRCTNPSRLPFVRIGGRIYYKREALERLCAAEDQAEQGR